MNREQIYLKDLECYINAAEDIKNHRRMCPNRCFDLTKLPHTRIRDEMAEFILDRGRHLSPFSIIPEFYKYNEFCRFINESFLVCDFIV